MPRWGFLTSHARVLLCIAHDPAARLRDIAARLGITQRSAHDIVTDLAEAGYVITRKGPGRRNRSQIQAHLLVQAEQREPAVGEVVASSRPGSPHRARPASYRDSSGSGEPAGPSSESDAADAAAGVAACR